MRALVYAGPGQVEWRDVPAPRLHGDAEALVRPLAVASCDLDAAIVRGQAPFPAPFILGHEAVAQVIAVGDGVRSVRPGDTVVVPFQISCGACASCRRGNTGNCREVPRTAMYGIGPVAGDWGGMLADVARVPFADAMLLPLPAGVSPAAAASAGDNIADSWRTVGPYLARRSDARVLILAGGPAASIPLYAVAIARALGAARVDYCDRDPARLALAGRLGAEVRAIDAWPDRLGTYAITVDASQDPDGLACAVRSTEPDGVCTSTSIYFQGMVPLPLTDMYMKGATFVTGRVHSRAVLPDVLALLAAKRVDPEAVVTERVSWDDAPRAILGYTTKLIVERPG